MQLHSRLAPVTTLRLFCRWAQGVVDRRQPGVQQSQIARPVQQKLCLLSKGLLSRPCLSLHMVSIRAVQQRAVDWNWRVWAAADLGCLFQRLWGKLTVNCVPCPAQLCHVVLSLLVCACAGVAEHARLRAQLQVRPRLRCSMQMALSECGRPGCSACKAHLSAQFVPHSLCTSCSAVDVPLWPACDSSGQSVHVLLSSACGLCGPLVTAVVSTRAVGAETVWLPHQQLIALIDTAAAMFVLRAVGYQRVQAVPVLHVPRLSKDGCVSSVGNRREHVPSADLRHV